MPRPKNKQELLDLSQENYDKLLGLINSYSEEQQQKTFPEGYLNRNIRDVLAHLYHWHLMVAEWHETGMTGEKPDIPAPGYTWKTLPALNQKIQEKYSDYELAKAKELFSGSHNKMRETINSHSNEELFEKKRYKWTGTTSVGAYFVSATSSHYDWALKLIKKCMKA